MEHKGSACFSTDQCGPRAPGSATIATVIQQHYTVSEESMVRGLTAQGYKLLGKK